MYAQSLVLGMANDVLCAPGTKETTMNKTSQESTLSTPSNLSVPATLSHEDLVAVVGGDQPPIGFGTNPCVLFGTNPITLC
jgi:hypothetical protein